MKTIKELEKEIEEVKKLINIREENYMDKNLPRNYKIQEKINILLGASGDSDSEDYLRTMDLDRGELLKLLKFILQTKIKQIKEISEVIGDLRSSFWDNWLSAQENTDRIKHELLSKIKGEDK